MRAMASTNQHMAGSAHNENALHPLCRLHICHMACIPEQVSDSCAGHSMKALDFVAGLDLLQRPMHGAQITPPPPAAPAPAVGPTSHHIVQEVRKSWLIVACPNYLKRSLSC